MCEKVYLLFKNVYITKRRADIWRGPINLWNASWREIAPKILAVRRNGRNMVEKYQKWKSSQNEVLSIVENVPTPRESIFKLSLASQRPYGAKHQKI